jgi:hypothetical protein
MKSHTCSDNWIRVHRMMLSLIEWNEDSYRLVMCELGDCPNCLRGALEIAVYLHTNNYALQAGSKEKAATYVADELSRLIPT